MSMETRLVTHCTSGARARTAERSDHARRLHHAGSLSALEPSSKAAVAGGKGGLLVFFPFGFSVL
jgi:hypothetical protein